MIDLPSTFLLKSPYAKFSCSVGEVVYTVEETKGEIVVHSYVRKQVIIPTPIIGTMDRINNAFLTLIEAAAQAHPNSLYGAGNVTNLENILRFMCRDMGRWDLVPKQLLVADAIELPIFRQPTLTITVPPLTPHSLFAWEVTLTITRYNMPMGVYLFAEPKHTGITHHLSGGQCMAIRPVGVKKDHNITGG